MEGIKGGAQWFIVFCLIGFMFKRGTFVSMGASCLDKHHCTAVV